ncbi:MAG: DNA alkylation repair protein [Sutterella sp.]|nr:DNA alkylation repair protein [Sutterella sp.]
MTPDELLRRLYEAHDPAIKAFGDALQPGITNRIGVRMPAVRLIARDVMKDDVRAFLKEALEPGVLDRQEAIMVAGIVIGAARGLRSEERLAYARRYLPLLDGWATCDLFGSALKVFREDRARYLPFIAGCLRSPDKWTVRTAEVWLLEHYREKDWVGEVLTLLDEPRVLELAESEYYLSMSLAWCLSMMYTVGPGKVADWMEERLAVGRLDRETGRRTVRKIGESFRPSAEEKAAVKIRLAPYFSAGRRRGA